jgi:hypothetical protein
MSDRALQIQNYFRRGLWKESWVINAIDKDITQEEADIILSK